MQGNCPAVKNWIAAALVLGGITLINQNVSAQTSQAKAKQDTTKSVGVGLSDGSLPEFPGGMQGLIKFLSKNLQYPKGAVNGKVFVTFTVKDDGSLDDIQIVRKLNPVNDAEVLRVLKLSPKWKPGTRDGEPSDSQYTLPISFSKA